MSEKFIRIYQKRNIKEIKAHLLIYGAISANCANCQKLGLKLAETECPSCGTSFQYISFQNIKDHLPKMQKLNDTRPELMFVDYDDFKRIMGELKAQEFLR